MNQIMSMLLGATMPGKNMPRFEYKRMTGEELRTELLDMAMPVFAFARIFGVRPQTVKKWLRDENDIPPWVHVALGLLRLEGALSEARQLAAEHIIRDNQRPGAGEFPFLERADEITEGNGDDDD